MEISKTSTNSVHIVNTSTASEKNLIDMSPSKVSAPTQKSDITGYRLVDMEILSTILSTLSCPFCKQATIKLSENTSRKMGLASSLKVKCTSCDEYCEEF